MEAVVWLRPEYRDRENELIHLAEGANLVGVTRAAVSNWAARHANFPKLVLLAGATGKRTKYVVREEFLTFARAQLGKKRTPRQASTPHRPRAVIRASQVEHLEKQVARLSDLESRQATQVTRTRAALRTAERDLRVARESLAAELAAAQRIAASHQA